MAFRLVVSNTVAVPVQGRVPDENGKPVPFNFTLLCRRLPASELRAVIENNDRTVPEFLTSVVEGWDAVLDADGKAVQFTPAGLQQLLEIVGMATVCFQAYLEFCGARGKEKN